MRVAFILRGCPGLARVIPSVVLDSMFMNVWEKNYQRIFFSYSSGYTFLSNNNYPVINSIPDPSSYRGYFSWFPLQEDAHILTQKLREFSPDLVVLDGEPYAVEYVCNYLKFPSIVFVPTIELSSGGDTSETLKHFYQMSPVVIEYGIDNTIGDLPLLGTQNKLCYSVHIPVRQKIFKEHMLRKDAHIENKDWVRLVGILGGGSQYLARHLWGQTLQIAENILAVCNPENIGYCTIFCSDIRIYEMLSHKKSIDVDLELISSPIDNTQILTEADFIVGRFGINILAEILSLGCRGLLVAVESNILPSFLEVSSNIKILPKNVDSTTFTTAFSDLLHAKNTKTEWHPGNEDLIQKLPEILKVLGI